MFPVTGLKILFRVGTHIFVNLFFSGKNDNFMHFERHFAFQNEKNYIFIQRERSGTVVECLTRD